MLTKTEALDMLARMDHAFISPEGAKEIGEPFGLKPRTYVAHANPHDLKGLVFYDGRDKAEGIDAAELAQSLCHHVGIKFPSMFGRGSQLRVCVEALREHEKLVKKLRKRVKK